MNLILFFSGILVLLSVSYHSEAQKPDSIYKKCYKAKTCVHNNHEKCGMNGNHEKRRFLDSCDIEEFNCLYDKDYKKISINACHDQPSLYGRQGKAKDVGSDQSRRNIPDKLEDENNPNKLNLGHNSIEYTDSSMPAVPQNLELHESNDLLRGGVMKMIGYNGTKTLRGAMIFNESSIHGQRRSQPRKYNQHPTIHKYWCWRAQSETCRGGSKRICARDQHTDSIGMFPDQCDVFKYNCEHRSDFMVTSENVCRMRNKRTIES